MQAVRHGQRGSEWPDNASAAFEVGSMLELGVPAIKHSKVTLESCCLQPRNVGALT